ncbi:MAG: M28 family peptidase [Longimicrobiales bacterium]
MRAATASPGDGRGHDPRASRGIAALVLAMLAALAAASCGTSNGSENGARTGRVSAPGPEFDAEAAFELLRRQVAFGPRVPGSAPHRAQLEWMVEYLRERADTVWVQAFTHRRPDGDTVPMANVVAGFRPDADARILLLAHWDTRPTADQDPDPARRDQPIDGANDGASGTAVLLQLADVLSRHSPPIGVDLLFTDGEDFGAHDEMYLGASYFAANQPPGYPPLYGILIDMVGDRDPLFPIESSSVYYAPEVVDRVWTLAEDIGYGRYFPRREAGSVGDDHIPLNEAGIRTIDIIDFEYGPNHRYWHTHQDVIENTSPTGLKAVGQVLTALVFRGG